MQDRQLQLLGIIGSIGLIFTSNFFHRFFSPKHIRDVGIFEDIGLLENDPTISALLEVKTLFPFVKEPDFVVSLGTGEPRQDFGNLTEQTTENIKKKGMLHRLVEFVLEKWEDRIIRDAIKARQDSGWYHRLNTQFASFGPRLDNVECIPALKKLVQEDSSISGDIDSIAQCMVASLFYFELDSIPERDNGRYVGSGCIFCTIRHIDPAFQVLMHQLSVISAQFLFNGCPISSVNDPSCYGRDGNFRKRVQFVTEDSFTISLTLGMGKPFNISSSPCSVKTLLVAQQLDAPFGRADHKKRKSTTDCEYPRKRQRHY